jgi:hypothetical protein
VVVEVNPANVVAVPYDYNFAKMRVCEYKVVEEIEPARIQEILDSEMYGDYYSLEDDFNYPDEEDTDFWDDVDDADSDKCGDPDCWCVN